jgi:mxaJ protein
MSSACRPGVIVLLAAGIALAVPISSPAPAPLGSANVLRLQETDHEAPVRHRGDELWVCADPNNLPFSNEREEGFENHIAQIIAADLSQTLHYFWHPQRRGFVRTTLRTGACDLIVGVSAAYDPVATTAPYYRSSYVFVTRSGQPRLRSFDDPRLKHLHIGIQLTGEDYENPPPAVALARRHLAEQVQGFTVYGDYSSASPQRAVIDAVLNGSIDTAVVWGPLAGYFASRAPHRLVVSPVTPGALDGRLPFVFDIAMGVRHGDDERLSAINGVLIRRHGDIERVLRDFHVPLIATQSTDRVSDDVGGL